MVKESLRINLLKNLGEQVVEKYLWIMNLGDKILEKKYWRKKA